MMSRMQNIIGQWLLSLKHYVLMCLQLSSPENLPSNPQSIALTVGSYLLVGLLLVDERHSYAVICAQILVELGLLGLIAYIGLRWKKSMPRFPQTFSALVGINLVFTVVMIPVYHSLASNADDLQYLLIYLVLVVWSLAVLSLIFKRAFEISTRLSAMISFNYFVINYLSVIWFI